MHMLVIINFAKCMYHIKQCISLGKSLLWKNDYRLLFNRCDSHSPHPPHVHRDLLGWFEKMLLLRLSVPQRWVLNWSGIGPKGIAFSFPFFSFFSFLFSSFLSSPLFSSLLFSYLLFFFYQVIQVILSWSLDWKQATKFYIFKY